MDYFEKLNEEEKYIANTVLENSLNEAPTTSAGQAFSDELIRPLIYYVQEALTTKELVDTQPIDFKKGKVFGMDLLDDAGNIIQGISKVDAFDETWSRLGENVDIPSVSLKLREEDVVLLTRKTQINYSQELSQDMKVLKFDLSKEKLKLIGTEIANGIDFDIVQTIKAAAVHPTGYAPLTYSWNNTATNNANSLLTELEMMIFKASAQIAAGTRKGLANFIIIPTLMVQFISTTKGFKGEAKTEVGAINKIGTLGYLDVYVDTFDTTTFDMFLGKKPEGNISSGIVYSPYKISSGEEVTDPDNFSIHQVIFNRYGITRMEESSSFFHKVSLVGFTGYPF